MSSLIITGRKRERERDLPNQVFILRQEYEVLYCKIRNEKLEIVNATKPAQSVLVSNKIIEFSSFGF